MGSSDQVDFDALVGSTNKSESEKEGGVFEKCNSKQYLLLRFENLNTPLRRFGQINV